MDAGIGSGETPCEVGSNYMWTILACEGISCRRKSAAVMLVLGPRNWRNVRTVIALKAGGWLKSCFGGKSAAC